ncbi:hypothetical protein DFH09DRAFT_1357787 [Mycena vulgaris]|nr:hypothetical protein DFH09DRAFT_1357787 [Mycena vulgaris]
MAKDSEKRGKESKEKEREKDKDREREKERDKDSKGTTSRSKGKGKEVSATAYGPEFLRAFARPASILSGTSGRGKRKEGDGTAPFEVITGVEAHRFARRFVREQEVEKATERDTHTHRQDDNTNANATAKSESGEGGRDTDTRAAERDQQTKLKANARTLPPVVFALPRSAAGDAGRKVVDFYMSWRGKTKTTRLKGLARRAGFLDAEFRRVRETLDGEWRRASRALKCSTHEEESPPQLVRAPTDPQPQPRLPPLLAEYAREERERERGEREGYAPQSTRSVSEPLPLPSSFPINFDPTRPPLGVHRGSIDSVTSLPLLGMVRGVPAGNRVPLRVTNPGDRMSMSSSSGSYVEAPKAKVPRGSPLRDGVAFDVPESAENASAKMYALQLPGRTASDSSGVSEGASSSGSSRKSKSKSRKEQEARVDDGGQEKILIVLLDEKDKPAEKDKPDDGATWHGLERRLSTRSTRKPSPPGSAHDSPWMGPLVHLDENITYINTPDHSDYYSESDSDADEGPDWRRSSGVVPIKSLLSAMGYLAPEAAIMGGTPSPYGSYTALPAPYTSPYAGAAAAHLAGYSSPYVAPLQGSPYPSPYQPHMQMQPPSRPQTPVSYFPGGTPPMQPQAPAWASPGGAGYPPTNYSSPAPAAYASPYASPAPAGYASPYASPAAGYASPAAGYASPAAGYASPAAGYTNLGAGYSSPYAPPLQGPAMGRPPAFYYS